jgi:hypothetical protein
MPGIPDARYLPGSRYARMPSARSSRVPGPLELPVSRGFPVSRYPGIPGIPGIPGYSSRAIPES